LTRVERPRHGAREHLSRLARSSKVPLDLLRVVRRMFDVFVERRLPLRLLRLRRDPHLSGEVLYASENVAYHVAHRPVRRQRHDPHPAVDVLHDGLVSTEVERDPEAAGAVRGRQEPRLPAAHRQP
jgi:hypothetical protein